MLKGLKITLFALLAVFSVGFLADLQIAEAVEDSITVNVDPEPEPDPLQLTVIIEGGGSGTVSSDPSGISCPESCIASYLPETSVTLTATASTGSTFSSWSDCNPVNENTCTVLMDEAKTVTATFNLITPSATITASDCTISAGQGSCNSTVKWTISNAISPNVKQGSDQFSTNASGNNVSRTIPYGTTAFSANDGATELARDDASASCAAGTDWSGSVCEGPKTLNVSTNGTGTVTSSPSGINCGTDCSQPYLYNTKVDLTAEAGTNYTFSSWSGCDTHDGTSCSVTMSSVKNVTANFTAEGELDGTIYASLCYVPANQSSCSANISWNVVNYSGGSTSKVTTPDHIQVGDGHSGFTTYPLSLSEGIRYFFLYNSGKTDYLKFDYSWASCATGTTEVSGVCKQNYTVTFNANGGTGTMSPQTFTESVPQNLTANTFANIGATFAGWNTSPSGTGTSYTDGQSITVSSNMTLYAMWTIIPVNPETYTVTFNANGGTGTMSPQTFTESVPQNLTANTFANIGATFAGWNTSSGGTGTYYSDRQSITVSSNMTLYAIWMSGTITANLNPCQIAEGQSSCDTTITWSVQNPISTTAVTTPVNQTIFTGHSGSGTSPVEYGERKFYLYNNSIELGQITASANCISGTVWNGSICQATPEMTGNLSVSPTSCEIPYDQESCSVSVSWNVYNPESSNTAVTISPNGEVFATGHSGSKDHLFTSSNSVTFYLYNNGKLLAQAIASATKEPAPPMEGTITANPNPCQIAEGQSTCNTTLAWSVQNPISYTEVTTPVGVVVDSSIEDSGDVTYSVEHGGRTFYLYNSEELLDQVTVSPICEGGTSWLGSSCEGPKDLTVSKNGAGTVTSDVYGISCGIDCSGVYAHGSRVTLTATVTEADNSMFSSWSGCDEVNGNTCTVLMNEDKNVTANFMEVWVDAQSSFVEGSSIYNTTPNTIITIPYTTSSSLSPSECRLLDYEKLPLVEYYETDNPITLTSPSSSGSYGYYIQCRNQNNHNIIAVSEEIIVNAVAVSVSLLKSFDTALPSSDYNFAFVPYSSPNVEYLNHVSCRLLDNDKKPQDDTWISVNLNEPNGIYHKLPGGYLGSFGYYIRCRNDVVTIAEADSDKMTITTYCPEGKKLYEGICVAPGISASDCVIETRESSCDAAINWEIPSLDGVWAITANIPAPNTTVVDIVEPNNRGQVYHTLPRVSDFPFFLYNDGVEVGLSRAYARCRPGTVWTFSPDGTTGTCEIMQNSIDVTICSIPLGENSCQTEASWALDNIPPGKDINDFIFTYPENKLVNGEGLVGDDRKQTLSDVTLFHGDNHFKIFDGADLIGERNILGVCVENTEWDTESGTCVIKEPEINYFKAEPETIFKGQSTTLSWNFEEDRVDYCLLQKKLSIDYVVKNLPDIPSEDYNGSLEDSPLGTTIYYMTCYKDGLDPTDTKEAIVSVIDMVIEEK